MFVIKQGLAFILAATVAAGAPGLAIAQSAQGSVRSAQDQSQNLFSRDRNIAVRERAHPGYEALGLPMGAFTAFPRFEVNVERNDNVFAVATGEEEDWIVRYKPEVAVESDWSRHAAQAYARASVNTYSEFDTEDTTDWGAGFSGRLDLTRAANLVGGADYSRLTEPRSSSNAPASAAEPIRYDSSQAYLAAARVSGRLKLSGRADWRSYDYDDGETLLGAEIDQDNRDRQMASLSGRADYALSPATAMFVQATMNERDYDVASTPTAAARDSSGYELLTGVNFEVGALSRGEIAVGYIHQEFDDVAYQDIDGFAARARVEYFPTELTTVTLTAGRSIEDSGVVGAGGYLSSALGLQIDHELLRNVIVTGQVGYVADDYDTLDRQDDRFSASVGGTYLLNRNLGVSLAYSHLDQNSDGVDGGPDFAVNRLILSLVSQF